MIMMTTEDHTAGSTNTTSSTDNATISSSPLDRRKRRRLNRNRALVAHEFDTILSQIRTTGSL
jgi:hypothetical protein